MNVTLCLFCFLGLLSRRPRAHSAGCWLSLLHLISIFSGTQTPSGFPRAPSVGCGFSYHTSSPIVWNSTGNSTDPQGVELNWNRNSIQLARRTQLSYIMVQRPLDLWNRMFDRHQAEITVSSSLFISQFPPTRFPLLTAIGMCHFLLVHHLEWNLGQVKRSKYNNSILV